MQTRVEKRFSSGGTLLGSYTFSKIIGDLAESWTMAPDRLSFTFKLKTPPASVLLKRAAGVVKGAAASEQVGTVKRAQVREIAEGKMADLNAHDVEASAVANQEGRAGIATGGVALVSEGVVSVHLDEAATQIAGKAISCVPGIARLQQLNGARRVASLAGDVAHAGEAQLLTERTVDADQRPVADAHRPDRWPQRRGAGGPLSLPQEPQAQGQVTFVPVAGRGA